MNTSETKKYASPPLLTTDETQRKDDPRFLLP